MTTEEVHAQMAAVFQRLRPVCVELAGNHTCGNVRALELILSEVTDDELSELQEYVLFPLRLILKQSSNRSLDLYTAVIECLSQVVTRTTTSKWEVFQDIFNSLCMLVSSGDSDRQSVPSSLSEELKVAMVTCLNSLLESASRAVRSAIYHPMFLPPLGHAVSILLHLVADETYRKLRVIAARCLLMIGTTHKEDDSIRIPVGNVIASFLPGITMAMTRIITGDTKQGHAVTTTALEVWINTVAVVMSDDNLEAARNDTDWTQKIKGLNDAMAERLTPLCVSRSEDWVKDTADKLGILVGRIPAAASHPSWQVRMALVDWASLLLLKCSRSLPDATPAALDVLVQLAADDYSSVASHSQAALNTLQTKVASAGSDTLLTLLEENVHRLATQLPRLMRAADDEQKLASLVLFGGYINLLGGNIIRLLRSSAHLQRVSHALLQVLDMDCSHLELVQQNNPSFHQAISSKGSDQSTVPLPRYYFTHFTDDRILAQITSVCRMLGYYGDLDLLVDHFLEVSHQGDLYKKQAFFCINEMILGTTGKGLTLPEKDTSKMANADLDSLITMLLDEYLSPSNWNLTTSIQPDDAVTGIRESDWQIVSTSQPMKSLSRRSSNVRQICILLEGIAIFSKVLGEGFRIQLLRALYPVMERIGDETMAINTTAQSTILEMATACGYSTVDELIRDNYDYLVHGISMRLRHIERFPRTPRVLTAILGFTTADILPLVEDTIQEVLLSLDEYYEDSSMIFMQVLSALVQAIRRWFVNTSAGHTEDSINIASDSETSDRCGSTCSPNHHGDDLCSFLLQYHQTKMAAEADEMDIEEDTCDRDEGVKESSDETWDGEKKCIPQHVTIVKQILERCCHLMPASQPRLRLLVLRTVADGCQVMQANQDELLPMAHKLWSPFVHRFQDDEPMVVLQALETLKVMGSSTGDFLRQRVVKEVLPPVANFLTKQANVSIRAGAPYRHTTACKLQVAAIQTISAICRQVALQGCELCHVARSCAPYLSCRQPVHLQQAALDAFRIFIAVDPDNMWLLLVERFSPVAMTPPHPCFPTIQVGSRTKNELSTNVETLLHDLCGTDME